MSIYAATHEGHFPMTMGDTLSNVMPPNRETSHRTAELFVASSDLATIPADPTAEWINAHSAFIYLGSDVAVSKFNGEPAGATVLMHMPLDHPLQHSGRGETIVVNYVDGHCQVLDKADAEKKIAESKARWVTVAGK